MSIYFILSLKKSLDLTIARVKSNWFFIFIFYAQIGKRKKEKEN